VKAFGILIGGAIFIFFLVVLTTPEHPKDAAAAIEKSCQEQFGSEGREKVTNCKIALMAKRLQEGEDAKLQRADRQAR
jgi:hypothetical protein